MVKNRPPLATRLRLARRVADVLLPQPEDVLIEATGSAERIAGNSDESQLRSDFVITVLDLRIRVALLPASDRPALRDNGILEAAAKLLWDHPETLSCMLVADDPPLSAVILEFGEVSDPAASEWRELNPRPVREVLSSYLATLRPEWPDPPSLDQTRRLSLDALINQASARNVLDRRNKRSTIEERKLAREKLGDIESHFIANYLRDVLLGKMPDFDLDYEEQAGDTE